MTLSISQAQKIAKTLTAEFNDIATFTAEKLAPGHHRVVVDRADKFRLDTTDRVLKARAAELIGRELNDKEIVFKGKSPIFFG